MKAKDYLKSKKIWLGTKVADMNAPENYFELKHLLEDYHQAKLKLLDIPVVVGRSELLKAFYAYIDNKWALGMLTDKVDEVIEDFEKSL